MNVILTPFVLNRDLPMVEAWLHRPHVEKWWGNARQEIEAIRLHPIEASALILLDDSPVGYLCWQTLTEEEMKNAGLTNLPKDLVDIDIMIGEPAALGHGVGPIVLSQLTAKLQADGVRMVGLGTAATNHRAIRAFEKAGFSLFQTFCESGKNMLYFTKHLHADV